MISAETCGSCAAGALIKVCKSIGAWVGGIPCVGWVTDNLSLP